MSTNGHSPSDSLSAIAALARPSRLPGMPVKYASPGTAAPIEPPMTTLPVPIITPRDLVEMQSKLPKIIEALRTQADQTTLRSSLLSSIEAVKRNEERFGLSAERDQRLNALAATMVDDAFAAPLARNPFIVAGVLVAATMLGYTITRDFLAR